MPREQRVDDLRHDGVLVAEDAGEDLASLSQAPEQVGTDLVLDRSEGEVRRGVRRALEGAQGLRKRRHGERLQESFDYSERTRRTRGAPGGDGIA